MAAVDDADPKPNTDLSGADEFAMHIFQTQAIKTFFFFSWCETATDNESAPGDTELQAQPEET